MLPVIDARTLFVASALIFVCLLVSVVLAWRELGRMRGPDRLALSYAAFFVGLVLFSARGHVPSILSITLANVLFVFGAALAHEAIRLFYGLAPTRRLTVWTTAAAAAAFFFFTHVRAEPGIRTILSSALLASLLGATAWMIWHRRPHGGSQVLEKVTSLALAASSLLFWARAVAIGSGLVEGEVLRGNLWMALPPLVCTLCAVVWTTALLANASRRLMNVVQSQNELLASLLAVTRAAGSASNLDATLERVLETACSLTGASGSSLLLLDEHGRFSRGLFAEGDSALSIGPEEASELLDRGLAGWVVRNRQAALIPDVATDPRWHRLPSQGLLVRSALSAPIENGPVLFGVLTLVHPEPEHFGEDQQHLIESTTAQVALAIRTAQLDDARQRATGEQELVGAVLEVSARGTEAEQIVADAASAIALRARSPRAYLALAGEDGHFRLAGRTDGLASLRPRLDGGLLGRAFEGGVTRQDEISAAGETSTGDDRPAWTRLVVPVRNLGRTLGLASFERPGPAAFDEEDVALAEAIAEAVGLGLGRAALARNREELTRMMVHDLRGPIAGVMGALELLGHAPGLEEADRKLLDAAERNVRRQLKLVEGILEIARLEEGALPVRQQDVELFSLVEETVRTMKPAAEARQLELLTEAPGQLPVVRADPGLVVRVLENLVGNAVKFSPPGSGAIRVSARRDGTAVEVFVRDCGPGVEEKVRARVFEKFAVGNQPGRGSGLGLAFCRLAVEAQGGRIWLEHPGPGAVFAFSIPYADAPAS
jgi:signal transduction histidine kinase